MKKYLMVVALMIVSTVIFAQSKADGNKKMGSGHADKMKKELTLSDDQYSKVVAIDKKYAEKRRTLKRDTSASIGSVRTQMKNMTRDHENEIKGVLTKEQWDKWAALKEQKHEERQKEHHKHKKDDNKE